MIYTFPTVHDTILAERITTEKGYEVEIIPRPPGDWGRCGIALRGEVPITIFSNVGLKVETEEE